MSGAVLVVTHFFLNVHASIGHEDAAGRKTALVRGEEKNHSGYFLSPAVAAQRDNAVEKFGAILTDYLSEPFLNL
jgi:hypothetical protein